MCIDINTPHALMSLPEDLEEYSFKYIEAEGDICEDERTVMTMHRMPLELALEGAASLAESLKSMEAMLEGEED